jgi:hypothetical protein
LKRIRKRFFFEKKKQKTFGPGSWWFHRKGLIYTGFFASPGGKNFLSKKEALTAS